MPGTFWTTCEMATLREQYPIGGLSACLAALPWRARTSIYQRARMAGLHAPNQPMVRQHYDTRPELDAALVRLHQQPLLQGAIRAFAIKWYRPTWWVSRRARELGLKTPRFKEPPWTEAETDILHDTAHLCAGRARLALLRAGFRRSETAVLVKRKRLKIAVRMARQDAGMYSGKGAAGLLGVCSATVSAWITREGLQAVRRGTKRETNSTGGDEWLIREADLRAFIVTHPTRVDLAKIPASNRAWFIDLVAGGAGLAVEKVA